MKSSLLVLTLLTVMSATAAFAESNLVEQVSVLDTFAGVSGNEGYDFVMMAQSDCEKLRPEEQSTCERNFLTTRAKNAVSKLKNPTLPIAAFTCSDEHSNRALFVRGNEIVYRNSESFTGYLLGKKTSNHVYKITHADEAVSKIAFDGSRIAVTMNIDGKLVIKKMNCSNADVNFYAFTNGGAMEATSGERTPGSVKP